MKRLTTNNENSILFPLNLFFAKNKEVWIRGAGEYPDFQDVSLVQWIKSSSQKHGLNLTADDPENLGDEMYDALQDGNDTVEGIVALMHSAAVQATEMRARLEKIEDILGEDYDLSRLRELVQADREGRCVVLSEPMVPMVQITGDTDVYCPTCEQNISGGWPLSDAGDYSKLCQCPHCGQAIDDTKCEVVEEALKGECKK